MASVLLAIASARLPNGRLAERVDVLAMSRGVQSFLVAYDAANLGHVEELATTVDKVLTGSASFRTDVHWFPFIVELPKKNRLVIIYRFTTFLYATTFFMCQF